MAWTYRPSLDGLRMLSMYLIVLYHAGVPWLRGSFIAVDLFFVLSGFLVTNVILSEIDRTGRLSLRNFYARRVRRLLPAAVVAIVGTTLLFLLVAPVVTRLDHVGDAQAALLYVANWRYLIQADDYFAASGNASPFLHYWTLSIEEQFYVLFPLLLLLLVRSRRTWAVPVGLAVAFGLSLSSQVYWGFVDHIHAYYGTDARAYQLLAGALLAVGMRRWQEHRLGAVPASVVASAGLVVFLLLTPTSLISVSQSARGVIATAAIVALIYGLMQAERQPLGWLLSRRTPVYLGKITYATYLWHWPLVLVLGDLLAVRPEVLAVMVAVMATALAAASNELLELPVRRPGWLDRHARPVVAAGVASCLAAAVVVVPAVLESERKPVLAAASLGADAAELAATADHAQERREDPRGRRGGEGRARLEPIPRDIDWKQVKEDTGSWRTCTREDPDDCVVHRGSGKHVLLVGDSHAMMLSEAFEMLAKEKDLTLSMNVVSACPWQENLRSQRFGASMQERCEKARVHWYDEVLPELDPDLVVLAARARDGDEWRDQIVARDGSADPLERATLKASRNTIAKIRTTDAEVALVEQVVIPEKFDPQECLATAKQSVECAVPTSTDTAFSNAFYRTMATEEDRVHVVSLNPALCPGAPVCAPVVDGRVVWRDKAHVTAGFATERRSEIWKALRAAGALSR